MKSKFDTGNWSEINGLPGQDDILRFMEHLTSSNPDKCYSRRELMNEVINEFGIPLAAATAEGPQSGTAGFYTRMTYLITDAIQGERRASKAFLKRVGYGWYQHITGNNAALKLPSTAEFRSLVKYAMVSVKILKDLKWEPERIIDELTTWSPEVVEAAIKRVFLPA